MNPVIRYITSTMYWKSIYITLSIAISSTVANTRWRIINASETKGQ